MDEKRVRELRNRVAGAVFDVGDKLRDRHGAVRMAEQRVMDRIHAVLPTPANMMSFLVDRVYALAFLLSDNCPKCDCWPCRCVSDVMDA
jgi:hypothetical protein